MQKTYSDWRTVFHDIGEESFAWMSERSGQTMTCERERS
jgi:hypothetical protein